MGIYDNIRSLAKNKGISINKLEQELGMTRGSMYKFNQSIPSSEKIQRIADYFGVPMDYLVNGKETLYEIAVQKVRQEKFVDMFNKLSPKDQDRIMLIMESFLNSDEYKEKEMQTS